MACDATARLMYGLSIIVICLEAELAPCRFPGLLLAVGLVPRLVQRYLSAWRDRSAEIRLGIYWAAVPLVLHWVLAPVVDGGVAGAQT
eukprot:COSAG01_NODE_2137_length_8329_cov_52.487242_12_plen_88_part_00